MTKIIVTDAEELQELVRSAIRQELGSFSNRPPDEKKYLTLSEASHFLKIPESTLYQFTSQRLIPFTKSGRRLMFLRAELESWLTSRRKATRQEMAYQVVTQKQGQK